MKLTKAKVIQFLRDKNAYNDVDEFLVEEFLYNLSLANLAKEDIDKRGVVVAINIDQTLFNPNPSVNVYQTAIKAALTIARKLGVDFRSRKELKIDMNVTDDDF